MKSFTVLLVAALAVASMAADPFLGHKGETGFIPVTAQNDEIFYWFFPSQGDAAKDPLVIWLTGGPGCSSELAIFMENGPFKIDPSTLKVSLNEYSWNKGANLLYVDQPIGTGYSNPVRSDYVQNEDQVALHMFTFIQGWLNKHESLKGRELFIIGESYAGHYVPAISAYIAKHKTADINFVGFGIGNGLIDAYYQYPAYATFSLDNKLIGQSTYNTAKGYFAQCQKDLDAGDSASAMEDCNAGLTEIMGWGTPPFNVYDIRKKCTYPPLCYDTSYIDNFLAQDEVIEALGVQGRDWSECNSQVHAALQDDWFTDLSGDVAYLLDNGYTGLIYYGDVDFICNWYGGIEVANQLNWSKKAQFNNAAFQKWESYGEFKQAGPLTFVRVFQSGHLVPMDQPAGALDLLETFLKGWAIPTRQMYQANL